MFPPRFDYERPSTVDDAVAALGTEDARVLAGGHSLLPALKARSTTADTLVDISQLDALTRIERDEAAEMTVIGAATTYAELLDDGTVGSHAPMVEAAIASVGDRQIRNRGTAVGNLVQADPGADVPAAAVAAGATLVVRGPDGERTVPVADLYPNEPNETGAGDPAAALHKTELATAVRIPDLDGASGAYVRKTHQATGYALVGVAARVELDGDEISTARIVATGIRRTPVRLRAAESSLHHQGASRDAAIVAGEHATDDLDPESVRTDPNVSGAYRLRVLSTYTERAVARAIDPEAGTPSPGDRR